MSDIPEKTKRVARERADGQCESCRRPMTDVHHRQRKGMGGTSSPDIHNLSNLVGLCRFHHSWAHANPAAAILCGLIVPTTLEPLMLPLWAQNSNYAYPAWFLLDNDGCVVWVTDEDEPPNLPPGMPSLLSA